MAWKCPSLRRAAGRDGPDQPRLHRRDDHGRRQGPRVHLPIPTYNITKDFPWESENAAALFEMTAKYGLPYFQNFINSELEPNMVRSMCCRLQLDLRELLKRGNGLFGSAEQTGSGRSPSTARAWATSTRATNLRCGRAGPPAGTGQTKPGGQAQAHPAAHGPGPVPHTRLPGHAAQPLQHAGRERHQRNGAQLHRRRARHHQPRATSLPCACLDHVRARA